MTHEKIAKLIISGNISASNLYSFEKKGAKMVNRPYWSILYKSTGETLYLCGGKRLYSNMNSIIVAPKGCDYEWQLIENGTFSYINFDSDMTDDKLHLFHITKPEAYIESFKRVDMLLQRKEGTYQLDAMIEIYSMLNNLLNTADRTYIPKNKQDTMLPVVEYMISHMAEPVTNETLAALTGYSTSHFRKIFFDVYHVSPISYMQSLRIAKGKELLRSGFGSITSIALSLGYSNIYDFSRAFKNSTGISPTEYAKTYK